MSTETAIATIHQALPSLHLREKIDTIRQTVAKDANDAQLEMFLTLAERYQLDPFLKEIWFSKEIGIITGRDGYLKVAQRDPNYDGIVSAAVCEGDVFKLNPVVPEINHEFGSKRGVVIGAYAVAFHKKRRPAVAYASFAEYQKPTNIWQKYRSAMICKVAEALALKRQFGISGLVTEEEVGAGVPNAPVSVAEAHNPPHVVIDPVHEPKTTVAAPPAKVQEMYRVMASEKAGCAKVFDSLRDELQFLLGESRGVEEYMRILKEHGVESWQGFKKTGPLRQCVLALYNKIIDVQSPVDRGEPAADLFAGEVVA
jgi:phage recombination protein Bet